MSTKIFVFIVLSLVLTMPLYAADTTKPIIASVTATSLTTTEATITWTTNESSTSQVNFGMTTAYGSKTTLQRSMITSHTVSLKNLLPGTTYHYRVKSKDAAKNVATSGDFTFATVSEEPAPPPPPPLPPPPPKAFPGAVGFGTETPGGRGGAILKVTNLNDSGPGSFRAAAESTGKRIVVFEVSGTILLLSELKIRSPYLTVAGQTAPSPGITLRGAELNVNTNDVLIQHIRIRIGDQLPAGMDPESLDGISADGPGSQSVVFDHISVSWALDENASSWGDNVQNVTFSNCIISEALYDSVHPKGKHSMGLLTAPNGRNISVIGNLLAHNSDRNPLITNGTSVVVANNVFYNWIGGRGTGVGNSSPAYPALYPTLVSVVGNVFIGGPNTTPSSYAVSTTTSLNTGSQIYLKDNSREKLYGDFRNLMTFDPLVTTVPVWIGGYTAMQTSLVENVVLLKAGARPLDRDTVDARVTNEVKLRTGHTINSQSEVGGWPVLAANYSTLTIPANPAGDDDGDGYTNVEEQLLFPMAAAVEGQ